MKTHQKQLEYEKYMKNSIANELLLEMQSCILKTSPTRPVKLLKTQMRTGEHRGKVTIQQMNSESSMHFFIYVFPAQ